MPPYLPILILLVTSCITSMVIIVLHWAISWKTQTQIRGYENKFGPYECGVAPVGNARTRFHVRFFMVAILFLMFDVEVIFFYLCAPMFDGLIKNGAVVSPQVGMLVLGEMFVFMAVLVLGLVYAWGKGALAQE